MSKAMRSYREMLFDQGQRRDGREDARDGKKPAFKDVAYMRGYREGLAPCQCDNSTAHVDGCERQPSRGKLCEFCKAGHNEKEKRSAS